jgi:hypothetical protein
MLSLITRKRLARLGSAIVVLIALYVIVVSTPWSVGFCGEETRAESWSPDGKHLAVALIRNCGATTGWVTHVNIRSAWGYFNTNWPGTITQGQVFSGSCWDTVKFVWKDNSNLEIQYEVCPRCASGDDPRFVKQNSWNAINLTYRELPCDPARK